MFVDIDRYSNEAERAKEDMYDDFNLKTPFNLHGYFVLYYF